MWVREGKQDDSLFVIQDLDDMLLFCHALFIRSTSWGRQLSSTSLMENNKEFDSVLERLSMVYWIVFSTEFLFCKVPVNIFYTILANIVTLYFACYVYIVLVLNKRHIMCIRSLVNRKFKTKDRHFPLLLILICMKFSWRKILLSSLCLWETGSQKSMSWIHVDIPNVILHHHNLHSFL